MKKFLNKIRDILTHSDYPKKFGISDEEFFFLVLDLAPDGAKIEFDQAEPDIWVSELRPWSYRENHEQFEADYYTISKGFRQKMKELITNMPNDFHQIHHFSIGDAGTIYVDSLDNFTVVRLDSLFEKKIRDQVKNVRQQAFKEKRGDCVQRT